MATLRSLECLVAVLDAGSITEAAVRLHMSQPALSHQLAGLEREIGTTVVERLPRGIRPTSAGKAMAADARAALLAADRVVSAGRAVALGRVGQLRIACAETMIAGLLAPVLRSWSRRHPNVALTLVEDTSADALAASVDSGQADIAVGPQPTRWAGHISLIGREEIVVAMAGDHPLAARSRGVSFAQLHGQPIVHYHPDNGLGGWLDGIAAQHEVTLTAAMRTRHASTAAQLAAAGIGIALVPTTALSASFPGALRRLKPPLRRDVIALIANSQDALVRRFVADIVKRGVPVPAPVAARLAP